MRRTEQWDSGPPWNIREWHVMIKFFVGKPLAILSWRSASLWAKRNKDLANRTIAGKLEESPDSKEYQAGHVPAQRHHILWYFLVHHLHDSKKP